MAVCSRSSIQNINNKGLWIRKNKRILNLMSHESDIDKIYLYVKDPHEAKYQYLINNGKK